MASTPSIDELTATIAALRKENERLQRENTRLSEESTEFYHKLTVSRGDFDNAMGYIEYLRNCVDDLRSRLYEGSAAAGGGPPVARTKTSYGPPLRGLPALGPSESGYGPCTRGEPNELAGIPAITHADHVALCATPSDPDLAVKVIAPGIAAWYRPP